MPTIKKRVWLLLVFSGEIFSCSPSRNAPPVSFLFSDLHKQKIDSVAGVLLQEGNTLGFSIALLQGNDTLYARGFGYADTTRQASIDRESIFQIASVSKFITSLAVLRLVAEKKVSLDSRVHELLPTYPLPSDAQKITVRHLLSHRSGIKEYLFMADSLWGSRTDSIDHRELLAGFAHMPAVFSPGSHFSYSNSGFLLLSLIIEKLSGKTYESYIKEELAGPADLSALASWNQQFNNPHARREFILRDGNFESSPYNNLRWLLGDGGLCATATDLARIPQLMVSEKIIPPDQMNQMLETQLLHNGAAADYGLGIRMGNLFGSPSWGHTGGGSTWTSSLLYLSGYGISLAVLTNTDNTPAHAIEIESRILSILFPAYNRMPESPAPLMNEGSDYFGEYANSYRFPNRNSTLVVYQHADGHLYRKRKGSETEGERLFHIGLDRFIPASRVFDQVVFGRDSSGHIATMQDYYNGRFMELREKERS